MDIKLKDIIKLRYYDNETILKDWEKLKETQCNDINQKTYIGSKLMNQFFFRYTIYTKSKTGISFIEFLKDKELMKKPYFISYMKNNKKKSELESMLRYFQLYYGSINLFKPIVAKYIYCKYKPSTVLDFSAGWGGRMLGAMSLPNINYIGFDTNKRLKKPYDNIIDFLNVKDRVKMFWTNSANVDFSKYDYDMVFTSPPYYDTEIYQDMPEYKDKDDFNDKFFFKVVRNSYKYMKKGGYFILNIPKDMYEDVKTILGKYDQKIILVKNYRNEYREYIYVWKK